ncbi:hypothetical protein LSH36_311g00022 [Paralvinella palmiformis]|uniref:G-protein coupled receptors family 1 profile domain-containing protein n=1 Tax=Paralvinella palmiformis TaxID=53620 RepID=A0AAD9N2V5_9ANNE|nr:hypothetical protein LSH36_311g00022 [Paralvinella palmiformis]
MDYITNSTTSANETDNNTTALNVLDPNTSKRTYSILLYGGIFLIVLGTIGNSLSLAVMMRENLRRHTTALYLMVLAVVDTAILYNWFLRNWTYAISGIDTRLLSVAGCKIHTFCSYLFVDFESWILVLVSFERLFAVFAPHRVRNIFTKKSAIIQITATGVFLVIVNLHFFWTQELENGVCEVIDKRYLYFSWVWNWTDLIICSFAPFAVMLSSNVAIITRLVYLQKTKKQSSTNKRNNTMTLTLIIVTFVFFLTTGPLNVLISTGAHWIERAKTNEDIEIIDVIWASFNILAYSNNAVNFILYCLSAPNFRKELAEMLHLEIKV